MIRTYEEKDLEEVLDVWYRASLVAHPFLSAEFLARERQLIAEEYLPQSETSVYERDGRVVGFVSMVGDEVGGIFVEPRLQRQGIGRALLDHAFESRSAMELGVFEKNELAQSFYAAYGFEVVGRRVEEDTGEPELRLRFVSG
ncbi:MAG: GNAT family N-acetyltransferase [Acidimicrobiia bacterium]|nr:GNAT family N-acetyltransferase [Acidimicrobiia bacterium]